MLMLEGTQRVAYACWCWQRQWHTIYPFIIIWTCDFPSHQFSSALFTLPIDSLHQISHFTAGDRIPSFQSCDDLDIISKDLMSAHTPFHEDYSHLLFWLSAR